MSGGGGNTLALSEEHQQLAGAVRRFLEARCPPAVARAALDDNVAGPAAPPPFWAEMAGLGWLGLHLPESAGGGGFGLLEAGVVLEELGRAGAPGPALSTVVASAALAWAANLDAPGAGRARALRDLAGGATGAVAFGALDGGLVARDGDGPGSGLVLHGTLRPVPAAAGADWLVLPASGPDGLRWWLLAGDEVQTTGLPSLDPTHPLAEVRVDSLALVAERALPGLEEGVMDALVAALSAADAVGGASWCVETASSYAAVRRQFGRPIGQFQGVKHRCADMLVGTEAARSVVWDALLALDGWRRAATPPAEAGLATAMAGAVAADNFCRTAKDCIQVLGGIGFTWEHDAHRYLRRAVSLRALVGPPARWRNRVAQGALSGLRRQVHVDLPPAAEARRAEVRAAMDVIAALPKARWRAALVESGYFVPHWPPPWGRDAGALEQLVIDQELARRGIRRANLNIGGWAAPTIAAHGTPEQQERWVGPTLRGEINWCQLFSEPEAGSDLASLTTRASRVEGGWRLQGQKVWTSMAAEADWGMCLARTDPDAPKQAGITYFVLDMRSAGLEIRPLREMTGLTLFNEVFLDDVFVPDDGVVGPVNGGWALARTTLANERVAMGSGASFGGGLQALLALAAGLPGEAGLGSVELDGLGELVVESHAVAMLGLRSTYRAVSAARPGPEASVRKLLSAEHDQRCQEFGLGLLGAHGAVTDGPGAQWSYGFLANRCLTIAGGTSEIQRNLIGERLLGLPRDPEA